jgi:hypothetical protein
MEQNKTPVKWLYDNLDDKLIAYLQHEITLNEMSKEMIKIKYQAIQMEQEHMVRLIHFMRTQDKMGKSIDDLFYQYWNENYENKS